MPPAEGQRMTQDISYQGLARKYRPITFEDLVGQKQVSASLQKALKSKRVAHGHILAGPRGSGKTTSARILAMGLNCESGPTPSPCGHCSQCEAVINGSNMDVIEIDAASNTGVDNMRELLERVINVPFAARRKVYIIDEVHMLSIASFNALLKTLEEPPPNVVFILATTELEKVPETVRSRCVLHAFQRLGSDDIAGRLAQVVEKEGVSFDGDKAGEIYQLIGNSVDGGMRDALVILDQVIALGEDNNPLDATRSLLGIVDRQSIQNCTDWLNQGDIQSLLNLIHELISRGRNLERFIKCLVGYMRDLMLIQAGADDSLISSAGEGLKFAKDQASGIPPARLFNIIQQLFNLEENLKSSTQIRFLIEFTFIRLATIQPLVPVDQIISRINAIPQQALDPPPNERQTQEGSTQRSGRVIDRADLQSDPPPSKPPILKNVMLDSTPGANVDPDGMELDDETVDNNGGADPSALILKLKSHLPDSMRYLDRYLRQVVDIVVEAGTVKLVWPQKECMAQEMVERKEHLQALQSAFTKITGDRVRIVHLASEYEPSGTTPKGSNSRALPARPDPNVHVPTGPVLADGGMIRSEYAEPDMDLPEDTGIANPRREVEKDATDMARTFINTQPDAESRIRMLCDMLNAKLVDQEGRPIKVQGT